MLPISGGVIDDTEDDNDDADDDNDDDADDDIYDDVNDTDVNDLQHCIILTIIRNKDKLFIL